ncbi:MAG TPA: hypothetical protein VK507_15050, partial [Iamia sp.]|nr:hypothetical protein [Iamia sp.]
VLCALMAALTLPATACGEEVTLPECRPTGELVEREADIAYRGPLVVEDLSLGRTPPLVIQVLNSEPTVERVQISIDGRSALDIDVPPDDDCFTGPDVFSFGYSGIPAGSVVATLEIEGIMSEKTLVVPQDGTIWGAVNVLSEREWSDMQVTGQAPTWG